MDTEAVLEAIRDAINSDRGTDNEQTITLIAQLLALRIPVTA